MEEIVLEAAEPGPFCGSIVIWVELFGFCSLWVVIKGLDVGQYSSVLSLGASPSSEAMLKGGATHCLSV